MSNVHQYPQPQQLPANQTIKIQNQNQQNYLSQADHEHAEIIPLTSFQQLARKEKEGEMSQEQNSRVQVKEAQRVVNEERGFKKIKNTQVNKLKQLRHEYQILKSIKIDDADLCSSKMSYMVSDSSSLCSEQSDISQKKKSKSQSKRISSRHVTDSYEKKQLQLLVHQTMKRIQELLQNQLEYKNTIHSLTLKLQAMEFQKYEHSEMSSEEGRGQSNDRSRVKLINKKLVEKLSHVETELKICEGKVNTLQKEKLELENVLLNEKKKDMNDEIQIKKLKMQYEMLEKQKDIEIKKLKATLMTEAKNPFSDSQAHLWKLQQQVKQKRKENDLLLKELSKVKIELAQNQETKQQYIREQGQIFQKLLKKIESVDSRDDARIKHQIESLKQQVQEMKNDSIGYDERQTLESRIFSLERIIEDENVEKLRFMEELRTMTDDYATLSLKYKKIKEKMQDLEESGRKLYDENEKLKSDISVSASQQSRISISSSQADFNNIIMKVKVLEGYERENQCLKSQLQNAERKNVQLMIQQEERIREISKKLDNKEIQVEKLKKENIINIQIVEKKYEGELNLCRNVQQKTEQQRDYWKRQFENLKKFNEAKHRQLQSEIQKVSHEYQQKLKQRQNEQALIRNRSQTEVTHIRHQYESEHQSLLNRLHNLTTTNQHLTEKTSKYIQLQSQINELREKNKKNMSLNSNIQHLWQVKEIQYENLNELLRIVNMAQE